MRFWSWMAFHAHLWLGVIFTVLLLVITVTGILLNHKRGLGLMPDVSQGEVAPVQDALPLQILIERAEAALAGSAADGSGVDRMDVRPRNGFVKVRFRDPASTEVTVELHTGGVLHVGPRGDVFMERLHTGEIFGDRWVLLSDAAGVALVLLLLSGYWLWLFPRWRRR